MIRPQHLPIAVVAATTVAVLAGAVPAGADPNPEPDPTLQLTPVVNGITIRLVAFLAGVATPAPHADPAVVVAHQPDTVPRLDDRDGDQPAAGPGAGYASRLTRRLILTYIGHGYAVVDVGHDHHRTTRPPKPAAATAP